MQPYIVQTFEIYKGEVNGVASDTEESMAVCLSNFYEQGYRLVQMSTVKSGNFITIVILMEHERRIVMER